MTLSSHDSNTYNSKQPSNLKFYYIEQDSRESEVKQIRTSSLPKLVAIVSNNAMIVQRCINIKHDAHDGRNFQIGDQRIQNNKFDEQQSFLSEKYNSLIIKLLEFPKDAKHQHTETSKVLHLVLHHFAVMSFQQNEDETPLK